MAEHQPRVLIVEDAAGLAVGLQINMEQEGYETRVVHDGDDALAVVQEWMPDVVILDLVLPGRDGFELLRQWRSSGHAMRILILSGKVEETDVVSGLRSGADDYVTKPFSLLELLARVRIQVDLARSLRNIMVADDIASPAYGTMARDAPGSLLGNTEGEPGLEVVFDDSSVLVGGRAVRFTPTEMIIFRALADARGEPVPRKELAALIGGFGPKSLALNKHVHRIRAKLAEIDGGVIVGQRRTYMWYAPPS